MGHVDCGYIIIMLCGESAVVVPPGLCLIACSFVGGPRCICILCFCKGKVFDGFRTSSASSIEHLAKSCCKEAILPMEKLVLVARRLNTPICWLQGKG